MKQYQGSTRHDREQQGATSVRPQAPSSQKEVPNRKGEEQKKIKANKPGEHRDPR